MTGFSTACTPGWAERHHGGEHGVTAFCGCGWQQGGFPSRRKALMAQKEHRFPGPNPRDLPADQAAPQRRAPAEQWLPRTPPSRPSRTAGT